RLGSNSNQNSLHSQTGNRFDLHFDALPRFEARYVRLVDVRRDNHVVQIGNGHDLGPAVISCRTGNSLADRNWPREDGAIERGTNFGFGEAFFDEMKGAFGALQRVGSQVELRTRVFKGFHRDQLILKEMPGSFEVTDGFLKGEFGAVHFRDPLRTLNLQVFVVEQAEQFAL